MNALLKSYIEQVQIVSILVVLVFCPNMSSRNICGLGVKAALHDCWVGGRGERGGALPRMISTCPNHGTII